MSKCRKLSSGTKRVNWAVCEAYCYEQWTQVAAIFGRRKFNWHTATLFKCEFDYDLYGPLFSFEFVIFGLGFYISVNPPCETKQSQGVKRRLKEIKTGESKVSEEA